ncbi:hypothetical protein HNP86_001906 [Methanococcus maripaludis]|uniref:Uncharacterized protein n=1 Tax=Methanococcus maripaludis TaxID=39152 RepID=A0A7J9NWQ1_METMI|nr:hypothetical protein [Methanococcus maripaludis]MBA2851747.1 hypothetical protein [Methanococcus maripaludis]
MIIQPHKSIFVGPVTSGESEAHQVTINMSLGVKIDDVLDDNANSAAMKWSVEFLKSKNYLTPDGNYPHITDVQYSQEDLNSFNSLYTGTGETYVYIPEFDGDGMPIYYDVACNFDTVPTTGVGKLHLPIIEAYNYSATEFFYKDAINFELIYNFDTVGTVTPLSAVSGNSTPFTEVAVTPVSNVFTGGGYLFYYTTTYLNDLGQYLSVNDVTNDNVKYVEGVSRNIQSQWFSGFIMRTMFPGFRDGNYAGVATTTNTFLNGIKKQLLYCNPHNIASVAGVDEGSYDYALVFYTAPYQVLAMDSGKSSIFVVDQYEGVMSVGNVNYYDDKYYVVPLKPGQILASPEGMMVSSIKYITIRDE